MLSDNMDESRSTQTTESDRWERIDASLLHTRQLYTAFEVLRTDHLLGGMAYLTDPLLRSLCELALLITNDTSLPVSSPHNAIEELRRVKNSNYSFKNEISDVADYLEQMSRERCETTPSSRNFSDCAWRSLRLLRSVSKRIRRAETSQTELVARIVKKAALWVGIPTILILCGLWALSTYRDWLSTTVEPQTSQRIADIRKVSAALNKFKHDHGHYPSTEGRWDGLYSSWGKSTEDWIPGLVPHYIEKLPQDPRAHKVPDEQYLYWSDGQDFKLLAHNVPDAVVVGRLYPDMQDKVRPRRAFGAWSQNAAEK